MREDLQIVFHNPLPQFTNFNLISKLQLEYGLSHKQAKIFTNWKEQKERIQKLAKKVIPITF